MATSQASLLASFLFVALALATFWSLIDTTAVKLNKIKEINNQLVI